MKTKILSSTTLFPSRSRHQITNPKKKNKKKIAQGLTQNIYRLLDLATQNILNSLLHDEQE